MSGRRFLVDSGAQRSIIPASSADTLGQGQGPLLDAANGTPIRTFGTRRYPCGSATAGEHMSHLRQLFERLSEHGLIVNPAKCQFGYQTLSF
ncbi:hypothetical protein WMY93_018246 [Mugilogobius chulae]|uniref:Peptidase A2 domain-containing protein n=1 Tax=Mugilogobius chulae TaxID=88201 RepID=A0AAW0NU81_9GOBI